MGIYNPTIYIFDLIFFFWAKHNILHLNQTFTGLFSCLMSKEAALTLCPIFQMYRSFVLWLQKWIFLYSLGGVYRVGDDIMGRWMIAMSCIYKNKINIQLTCFIFIVSPKLRLLIGIHLTSHHPLNFPEEAPSDG